MQLELHFMPFPAFPTLALLTSAQLTLTLKPGSRANRTDFIRIEGLNNIEASEIQDLEVGVEHTIRLELLDFYSSIQILDALDAAPNDQIRMHYEDDALISFAQLDLVSSILGEALRLTSADVDLTAGLITLRGDFPDNGGDAELIVALDGRELNQVSTTPDEIVADLPPDITMGTHRVAVRTANTVTDEKQSFNVLDVAIEISGSPGPEGPPGDTGPPGPPGPQGEAV